MQRPWSQHNPGCLVWCWAAVSGEDAQREALHRAVWDLIVHLDFLQAALQSPGFQEWACINRLCFGPP